MAEFFINRNVEQFLNVIYCTLVLFYESSKPRDTVCYNCTVTVHHCKLWWLIAAAEWSRWEVLRGVQPCHGESVLLLKRWAQEVALFIKQKQSHEKSTWNQIHFGILKTHFCTIMLSLHDCTWLQNVKMIQIMNFNQNIIIRNLKLEK